MNIYKLRKGSDIVEVMAGREQRRDQLLVAGYKLVNQPKSAKGKLKVEDSGKRADKE